MPSTTSRSSPTIAASVLRVSRASLFKKKKTSSIKVKPRLVSRIDEPVLSCTRENVRSVEDEIFFQTFVEQIEYRWEEHEELRMQRRTEKSTLEEKYEDDAPPFLPFVEVLSIGKAFASEYQVNMMKTLNDRESFNSMFIPQFAFLCFSSVTKLDSPVTTLLEAHAFLRAHVPGYKKGKKEVDRQKTLAIIRKLRPSPQSVSPEPTEMKFSSLTPWVVQQLRIQSEEKEAVAKMYHSTLWAAPERRGIRPISLRMKMEEDENDSKMKKTVKRRKLVYK